MSQPTDFYCNVPQPGALDEELNEFWVGNPWEIFERHNLSCFERNRLFLNSGGTSFVDVSHISGADDDGDGRAAIAVDVNHNGMLDLIVRQAGGGPLRLFENNFEPRNFVKVTLRGVTSNKLGVGARLVGRAGDRDIVRECYPVNSYLSQTPLVVHFGLDDDPQLDELLIRWPSGTKQLVTNIPANLHVVITEDQDGYETTVPGQRW